MGSQRFRHEWATELTLDVGDSFWWFWHPSSFVSWPFWPLESLPDMFETLPDELQSLLRYMRIFWHSEDYYSLVWDFSWHIWDFSVWDAFWLFDTVLTFFFSFSWLCHAACELLAPQPEIEPGPCQWEHGVLTTGPPGECPCLTIF